MKQDATLHFDGCEVFSILITATSPVSVRGLWVTQTLMVNADSVQTLQLCLTRCIQITIWVGLALELDYLRVYFLWAPFFALI